MTPALSRTIELIDSANREDPNIEYDEFNTPHPKELLYSIRMSKTLSEFATNSSEHLQIAARGQHIERWKSPREDYPEGRAGYKKWRAELGLFHAKRVGELMAQSGYSEEDIQRTQYLVQKRGIKRDPESQTLEDVICLVFIKHYLEPFAAKHDEEKLIDIIRKTWTKMSEAGHNAALQIQLPKHLESLVGKALST